MTDCTCTNPGFCERHKVKKNAHWHHLCQTRADYFDLWEHGRGPGQQRPPVVETTGKKKRFRRCNGCGSNAWYMVTWDFLVAMTRFVWRPGFVTREQYHVRLTACQSCDQLDTKTSRCKACGCFVKIKARGAVWDCPQGKWPEIR